MKIHVSEFFRICMTEPLMEQYNLTAASEEIFEKYVTPTCKRGVTIRGKTLRGGILTGEFKSMGLVDSQRSCTKLCCQNKRCDIAMTLGSECINIRCFDKHACTIAPVGQLEVYSRILPVVTFVRRVDPSVSDKRKKRYIGKYFVCLPN